MPKTFNVQVATMDSELEFAIHSNTTGKQLFDQVVRAIGLRENWFFGLVFIDGSGLPAWLELNKKIQSQDVKKETPLRFRFRAKYYPEDVADELILNNTRNMFFLQVREAIVTDEYYCPPETSVLLASYAVQVKFSDYNPDVHKPGFLTNEKLLPPRVIKQHSLTKAQWDERVLTWYSEHKGMHKEDAILEFLKIAQDLEMYGINYYEILNKKGTKLWLGVDALGVNIYEKDDKLTPKIGFPWSEIRNVSFSGKKFVIKPVDKNAPDFIFYSSKEKINKRILSLCTGNHELYMRRRKPDSIEVQQMKAQAREEKAAKDAERSLLIKEKLQREDAERQQRELEERLRRYEEEMERSKHDLERSQKAALELEQRMRELEHDRRELEEAQRRAEEARRMAEEAAYMEKAEREIKEQEAIEAQALLERKIEEAREREEEAHHLQEELIQARILMEENQRQLEQALNAPPQVVVVNHTVEKTTKEIHKEVHEGHVNPGPQLYSVDTFVTENGGSMEVEEEEDNSDHYSRELIVDYDVDHVEVDRITQAEKDARMNEHLKALSADLKSVEVAKEVPRNEFIYRKNVSEGRDKYKTLKQIRQGNTKIRVEIFESM